MLLGVFEWTVRSYSWKGDQGIQSSSGRNRRDDKGQFLLSVLSSSPLAFIASPSFMLFGWTVVSLLHLSQLTDHFFPVFYPASPSDRFLQC